MRITVGIVLCLRYDMEEFNPKTIRTLAKDFYVNAIKTLIENTAKAGQCSVIYSTRTENADKTIIDLAISEFSTAGFKVNVEYYEQDMSSFYNMSGSTTTCTESFVAVHINWNTNFDKVI